MDTSTLLTIYRRAALIRAFEKEIAAAFDNGEVPGLVHLCDGAELFEAALLSSLDVRVDQVAGSHRSHGLALGCGVDPEKIAREILGRAGGLSEGLGGTQHLLAAESGFLGSNGIVGAQVPLAAGAALSAKTLKTGGIAVAFFGDGAANQGAVLETMNLAAVLQLPLLFVMENNGFGQSTASVYASAGGGILARARAHGLAADQVDGTDIEAAHQASVRMIDWVRSTSGPALIEALVPRLGGHYHGDEQLYRDTSDHPLDPLDLAARQLEARGLDLATINDTVSAAEETAKAAVDAARRAEDGSLAALTAYTEGAV